MRAIAEAKIKTDKVDSRVLAELLRCDYLPEVSEPDQETQRLRRLTHRRAAFVRDRTRLKNRLQSILHHTRVPLPEYDLFSKRGITWLKGTAAQRGRSAGATATSVCGNMAQTCRQRLDG
ncbi:MAG TPA: transposase [Candidatus Acidoferrum sp.]|nr:transposase [Candidatus Acidoferrum sp.]